MNPARMLTTVMCLACLAFCGCQPLHQNVNAAAFGAVDDMTRSEFTTGDRLVRPARVAIARVQATPYYCEPIGKHLNNGGPIQAPLGRAEYGLNEKHFEGMQGVEQVEFLYPVTPLPVPTFDPIVVDARAKRCDYLLLYTFSSMAGGNKFGILGYLTLGTVDPNSTRGEATCAARLIDVRNGQVVTALDSTAIADWLYLSGRSWSSSRDRAAVEAESRALRECLDDLTNWWNTSRPDPAAQPAPLASR